MIKIFCITFGFLSIMSNMAYADLDWTAEARVAAFVPVNSRFQKIYGHCRPSYEIEIGKGICRNVAFFGNINYYSIKGKSIGFSDSTRINNVNFSFGPKLNFDITCNDQAYIGIGAVISDLWIKNHTNYCHKRASKAVFGGVVKLGINHNFTEYFFLDLFADYYYQPVKFESHIDVGGLKAGLGLGYRF